MDDIRVHRLYILIGQRAAAVAILGIKPALGHRVLALKTLDTLATITMQFAIDRIARDTGIHVPDDETVAHLPCIRELVGVPHGIIIHYIRILDNLIKGRLQFCPTLPVSCPVVVSVVVGTLGLHAERCHQHTHYYNSSR